MEISSIKHNLACVGLYNLWCAILWHSWINKGCFQAKSAKKVVKKTATKGEKGASAKKKVKKEEKDGKSDKEVRI